MPAGRHRLALCCGLMAAALACARTVPPARPVARLYRDLQRLVTIAEAAEWKIDRQEVREIVPDALLSVCGADPASRQALAHWLDAQIELRGGDVAEVYRRRGRDLDRVEELLELTRIRKVLRGAEERAEEDCPFWITAKRDFRGRQISDDRWQLSAGGGGRGNLVFQGGSQDLSFGGAGRLLFGRAFGDRIAIYTGVEIGGQASIPRDDMGERSQVELDFELAVPAVLRYRMVNSYFEVEPAYLLSFDEDDIDNGLGNSAHGFRIGFSVGARALKTRWFFPGAALQVIYDRVDPDDEAARHTLRLGFRVAFDLNL